MGVFYATTIGLLTSAMIPGYQVIGRVEAAGSRTSKFKICHRQRQSSRCFFLESSKKPYNASGNSRSKLAARVNAGEQQQNKTLTVSR